MVRPTLGLITPDTKLLIGVLVLAFQENRHQFLGKRVVTVVLSKFFSLRVIPLIYLLRFGNPDVKLMRSLSIKGT